MKKLLALMAVLALGTAAAFGNGLAVYGSYWDTKDAEGGPGAGAKVQIDLGDFVALEARGGYFPDLSDDIGDLDLDLQVIPIEVAALLKMGVADTLMVYGGGGVGYYMLDADFEYPTAVAGDINLDDEVGWFVVGGAELYLTDNLAIIGEVKYTAMEGHAEKDDIDEIKEGRDIDLAGFGANAGLMLTW